MITFIDKRVDLLYTVAAIEPTSMQVSLSKFFPKNTEYFYSFPYGEDSNFFSYDPQWKVELIAARPIVCAGPNVKVIAFAATNNERVWKLLRELGGPLLNPKRLITLPIHINAKMRGAERNRLIKRALQECASKKKLVMAQPYLSEMLDDKYSIPPEVSVWCNDKKHIVEYVPLSYMPKRFITFPNGKEFFESNTDVPLVPLPCVVKVSASAGGDGVRICSTPSALTRAKKKFRRLHGSIFIEQYIDTKYNLGIQFGIPYYKEKPIEIIGINEQLTTQSGEYLGAIVDLSTKFPEADTAIYLLLNHILSAIRARGWYGVGAFDVLIGKDGHCYFIDANCRMSAMTPYLHLLKNKKIKRSFITFTGTFRGTEDQFRAKIFPVAKNGRRGQRIRIIALTQHNGSYHFNAAMFFSEWKNAIDNAKYLRSLGIESKILTRLLRRRIRAHEH